MGRKPCCGKGVIRGAWSAREDEILVNYIKIHGEGKWTDLPRRAGLRRCGKSCRLRWLNYLRPDIKRGNITEDEDDLIIRLHKLLGNRWTLIAGRLPGRTDNEIKNYWNTNLSKRVEGHNNTLKTSEKLIKATQNQEIHPQAKHRIISPVAVRFTESKAFPGLHHCLNINDTDHSTKDKPTLLNPSSDDHNCKSSGFLMNFDIDIGDFLSLHQQKEMNLDFADDMTGEVNFPTLAIETGKGTETNCSVDVAEPLHENDWDLEAIASFLCSEDVLIG